MFLIKLLSRFLGDNFEPSSIWPPTRYKKYDNVQILFVATVRSIETSCRAFLNGFKHFYSRNWISSSILTICTGVFQSVGPVACFIVYFAGINVERQACRLNQPGPAMPNCHRQYRWFKPGRNSFAIICFDSCTALSLRSQFIQFPLASFYVSLIKRSCHDFSRRSTAYYSAKERSTRGIV